MSDERYRQAREADDAGDREKTEVLLREVLAATPAHAEAACDLAMVLMEREENDAAEQVLSPALASAPEHPRLNLYMAMALAKRSVERARSHAAKAIEAAPDDDTRAQARALYEALAQLSGG